VKRGQTVIIMESMKMELTIAAHRDGVVKRIPVEQGGQVEKGMRLLELEDQPDSAG
jgi:3-methylcrotonyl-CoA carboxylase alpha subunit